MKTKTLVFVLRLMSFGAGAEEAYRTNEVTPVITDEEEAFFLNQAPEDQSEILTENVSWGRPWTCFARNRRGQVFSGRSSSRSHARQMAMSRCARGSGACAISSCR